MRVAGMAAPCVGKKGSLVYFPLTGESLPTVPPPTQPQPARSVPTWLCWPTRPPPHTTAARLRVAWGRVRTEVPQAAPKVDIKLQTGDSNPQRNPRENHGVLWSEELA